MRGLKFQFRVWDKDKQIMLYWDDILRELEFKDLGNPDFIPMNCLYLEDLNRKVLFEGDIIREEFDGDPGENGKHIYYTVVKWEDDNLLYYRGDFGKDDFDGCYFNELGEKDAFEIVGNVWQNPKLIKKTLSKN